MKDNYKNQILLSKYIPTFISHLQYNLGQTQLVCEIFKDNIDLVLNVSQELLNKFSSIILNEGRQVHFLDFF